MRYFFSSLLLLFVLASCKDFKEPVFDKIENVKMGQLNLDKPVISLQMKYFNPNKFAAKLKNAEGDAWMENSYLGHFTVDTTVAVPANSDFHIPVNLAVDMKSILQNSFSLLLKDEVNIKITGKAKAGRAGFYKSFPIYYEGKQDIGQILR